MKTLCELKSQKWADLCHTFCFNENVFNKVINISDLRHVSNHLVIRYTEVCQLFL